MFKLDLHILLIFRILSTPPRTIPLPTLYFVFNALETLLNAYYLSFDDFSDICQCEPDERRRKEVSSDVAFDHMILR
jgi:hypothetical protein